MHLHLRLACRACCLGFWGLVDHIKFIIADFKVNDNHILQSAYEYLLVHPQSLPIYLLVHPQSTNKETRNRVPHSHSQNDNRTNLTRHAFANRDLTGSLRVQYSGHFDCVSMLLFFASCP